MEKLPGDPSLPPGLTHAMIDRSAGDEIPDEARCDVCLTPLPVVVVDDETGEQAFGRCPRGCDNCC